MCSAHIFNLTKSRSKVQEQSNRARPKLNRCSIFLCWILTRLLPRHKVVTMVTAYLFTLITDMHRMDDQENALFYAQIYPVTRYFHLNLKAPCQLMGTLFKHGHQYVFCPINFNFLSGIKILETEVVFDM